MTTLQRATRTWMKATVLVSFALVGACRGPGAGGGGGDRSASRPCPDLPRVARLDVAFEPPLARAGTFELELDVAGAKESCAFTISGITAGKQLGGVVEGPTTRTETTCKSASVSGITMEGAVAGIDVAGTARTVKVRVLQAGKVLGEGAFEPSYTPDECGFVRPRVSLKLAAP